MSSSATVIDLTQEPPQEETQTPPSQTSSGWTCPVCTFFNRGFPPFPQDFQTNPKNRPRNQDFGRIDDETALTPCCQMCATSPLGKWQCPRCTCLNGMHLSCCQACGGGGFLHEKNDHDGDGMNVDQQLRQMENEPKEPVDVNAGNVEARVGEDGGGDDVWSCPRCTVNNPRKLRQCSVCDWIPTNVEVGSGENGWNEASMEVFKRFGSLEPEPLMPENVTSLLGESGSDGTVTCARPLVTFKQTFRFDCGYRNIQGMSWFVLEDMRKRKRASAHKSFSAHVPSIRAIQRRIEQAWKEGFDQQGCAHFGGKLVNKKLWIGTTEAAVFFRSLGLRAVIVDFKGKPSYPAAHLPLADFLRCYFAEAAAFKAGGKYPYLSFASSWRSPLYFQHQGHSRTVIGLQQVSEKDYHLLVLDPASRSKAVSVIKSNSLKKSDYQLLFMLERRDEGIVMSTQERERSKDLSRSHLYLVENGIMRNVS